MSVWNSPCYAIEPLRNATNNLPLTDSFAFPEELAGIADFTFGDCGIRHKERAGKRAADYFRENPEAWSEFFHAGVKNLRGSEAIQFRNTLDQANTKYAGIRAVYWVFKKFATKEWEVEPKLDVKEARTFVKKAFNISASAARINQQVWEEHGNWYDEPRSKAFDHWEAESIADAVRFLWTIRSGSKNRSIIKKRESISRSLFGQRFRKIKCDRTLPTVTKFEGHVVSLPGRKAFNPVEARACYSRVRKMIDKKQAVSTIDADRACILPYVEYPSAHSRLVIFMFRGGYIYYDTYDRVSAFILSKDHDRIVQMLQGNAKLMKYYSKYAQTDRQLSEVMARKYSEILSLTINAIDVDDEAKCNKLCRAFDVCQFLLLARLADDVNDAAIRCQEEKIRVEGLESVVDIRRFMRIVDDEELGVKESLELAKFNKIFPCPDFCIYSVVDSIEKKAVNGHTASDKTYLGSVDGSAIYAEQNEFRMYCMRNRLINYFDVHKYMPGKIRNRDSPEFPSHLSDYPNVAISSIRVEDMEFIDLKGAFLYRHYDGAEHELVKDKVIAPTARVKGSKVLSDYSNIERNQVLKFLFSKRFIDQKTVCEMAVSGELFSRYHQWILLALKAEAKKPGSRAFSMATDEVRRLLSEAEMNVATYVRHQRGSSQGKSEQELSERLANLSATPDPTTEDYPVMLSFDLEGFSPMQDPVFKERAMSTWSEVFDEPSFDATARIFTDTTLEFHKFDVTDTFKMIGNDLEGFNGRMNTSAHIDLMGYAVYKLKKLRLTRGAASLEVLIDDGALRIEFPFSNSDSHVENAIKVIDKVYKFAGQKISWDKTFVSRVLMQYLNRVYYDGIEVTPGAKAFMRIGKKQEVAIPTLIDELMAHGSAARGAIQSGSDHFLAYHEYIVEIYKSLKRWGYKPHHESHHDRMSFALHIPVGLGGFGISNLHGLSTNEGFNSMQAGIASMKMICHRFPGYAQMANLYLNAGLRDMSEDAVLRNPTAWRTKLRCLNLRRFENSAKAKVMKTSANALIKSANRGDFDSVDDAIVGYIAGTRSLSEIKRKLLFDMSSGSLIDSIVGKLQSSTTAASLLGKRRCMVILIANKSEARQLIKETMMGKLVYRER